MLKLVKELYDLEDFNAWGQAVDTKQIICDEGLGKEFMNAIGDVYPDGLSDTELNDILAFDSDFALSLVGLAQGDEE